MTVIFSNAGDEDCLTIKRMWAGIPDVDVVEFTRDNEYDSDLHDLSDQMIATEEDFLILCGHGSPEGLYSPSMGSYIFSKWHLSRVKAKKVLCIWCWADEFCTKYDFPCLTSSMYISNNGEAYCNVHKNYTQEEVNDINIRVYDEIREHLINDAPLKEIYESLKTNVDETNDIDKFNRGGFILIE